MKIFTITKLLKYIAIAIIIIASCLTLEQILTQNTNSQKLMDALGRSKTWGYITLIAEISTAAKTPKYLKRVESVAAKGGIKAIEAGEYTITKTVSNNITTRPYINSPSTITNIMKSSKGKPDAFFKGGVNNKVSGTFNGSSGIFELGINPKTNTIYHFLFKTVK